MTDNPISATSYRRQSVEAPVIYGCRKCGAPGVYQELTDQTKTALAQFPAILLSSGDPRIGTPVGDVCPCCGGNRQKSNVLGEIWHKLFV